MIIIENFEMETHIKNKHKLPQLLLLAELKELQMRI